jgi:hypothetical protein
VQIRRAVLHVHLPMARIIEAHQAAVSSTQMSIRASPSKRDYFLA